MIENVDAINAIDIVLNQPIFLSEGEVHTITGYDREDFERVAEKLQKNLELSKIDCTIIWQALAVFGAFRVDPEIMTERFGRDYDAAIDKMMKSVGDHLGFVRHHVD